MKRIRNPDKVSQAFKAIKKGSRQQQGFSLLEMLVAFSILAIALGILLNIFSSGMQTAIAAEEYTAAVQIAESLMARTGLETPLQAGQANGLENEKYRWQLRIEPFELTMANLDTKTIPASLFMVTVTVNWGEDVSRSGVNQREIELTTLKISTKTL